MRTAAWLLFLVALVAIAAADPGTGTVIVGCNESDAALLVDGVLIPERTPAVLTLPVGPHVIEVRKAPLISQKKVIEVGDQQQVKIRFELLPPAPPPPPPDALGSATGSGSGSGASLPATGSAAIGSGSAAPPIGSAAAFATGSATHVEPPHSSGATTVDIATTAPHAIAYVDGAPIHSAPCVLELEPGEHVIAVYTSGMLPAETVVTAKPGQRQRVELTPSKPRKRLDVPAQ